MSKQRLDMVMVQRAVVISRSQAESYIKLGKVKVNGKVIAKPGYFVSDEATIELTQNEQYVSRAGLKLASVARILNLDFKDKVVLDVGSSTGGFTDYALKRGAKKVISVEVGTNQLHPSLHGHPQIELHEQTNILDVRKKKIDNGEKSSAIYIKEIPDIVVIDVSFVSLRELLPHIAQELTNKNTRIVAMLKPQFEAGSKLKNKGVIKNSKMRREILRDFEEWAKHLFVIKAKADSDVAGAQGNQERFYLLSSK